MEYFLKDSMINLLKITNVNSGLIKKICYRSVGQARSSFDINERKFIQEDLKVTQKKVI